MKTATTNRANERTIAMETLEVRELEVIDGGLNGTLCIPGVIRLPLPGPTPGTPAPFRDIFAKYTIGPV
jgi:hypothetical protein